MAESVSKEEEFQKVRRQVLVEGASIYMLAKLIALQFDKVGWPSDHTMQCVKIELEKRFEDRKNSNGGVL